jgi:N-sulfoglucosamine sulfohydrolase
VYDPGIHLPLIIKQPQNAGAGVVSNAMVSWTDIAPTLLDYAGAGKETTMHMHGRSLKPVMQQGDHIARDTVFASHTFHEIEMYYPMRVVRTRKYKFIWNIAHKLDYPLTLDLIYSSSWKAFLQTGKTIYGKRPVADFLKRPAFELYDLEKDPHEVKNLADHPDYQSVKNAMMKRLQQFQTETGDPWVRKWDFE